MEKLYFTIDIKAPKERVWKVLWEDATYREWTSVFSEGSYATGGWEEGSRVRFLTPEGSGMYSTVLKNIPAQQMTFQHLGVVKDGVDQPEDEESRKWSGSLESYMLREEGDTTSLNVEIDSVEEFKGFFSEVFPKALEKIRSLSEKFSVRPGPAS
jgi:hypothetical protein